MKYFPATGINVHVHVARPGELRLLYCRSDGNDKDIARGLCLYVAFYRFSIERRGDSDMRIRLVEMEMNNPVGIVPEQSKSTIKPSHRSVIVLQISTVQRSYALAALIM